jgi:hypothetical protein
MINLVFNFCKTMKCPLYQAIGIIYQWFTTKKRIRSTVQASAINDVMIRRMAQGKVKQRKERTTKRKKWGPPAVASPAQNQLKMSGRALPPKSGPPSRAMMTPVKGKPTPGKTREMNEGKKNDDDDDSHDDDNDNDDYDDIDVENDDDGENSKNEEEEEEQEREEEARRKKKRKVVNLQPKGPPRQGPRDNEGGAAAGGKKQTQKGKGMGSGTGGTQRGGNNKDTKKTHTQKNTTKQPKNNTKQKTTTDDDEDDDGNEGNDYEDDDNSGSDKEGSEDNGYEPAEAPRYLRSTNTHQLFLITHVHYDMCVLY